MLIKEIDESNYFLRFENAEIAIMVNIIVFIIENLECDLFTRTGFDAEEYRSLVDKLGTPKAEGFSIEELAMMHQALNEVCHGIAKKELEDQVRLTLPEARGIFEILHGPVRKYYSERRS
ncbi:MAG: hypothetical protein Q8927_08640 [Bacteroidota bacterium]|nr:hypothetical protein [Bacteroidota bacterium]MDP4216256.1 hypothetical protein [Bacteroidota bacterium]MDP4253704.1 hypothetical protein [Bacteroidota bacterium]MDP4259988.1 hypothetical protein [Bacteroidota bacterium]